MTNKGKNYLKIEFVDGTHLDEYNETREMKSVWYGEMAEGQVLDMETYYTFCKEFAAAMGFAESTINEWFGDY